MAPEPPDSEPFPDCGTLTMGDAVLVLEIGELLFQPDEIRKRYTNAHAEQLQDIAGRLMRLVKGLPVPIDPRQTSGPPNEAPDPPPARGHMKLL